MNTDKPDKNKLRDFAITIYLILVFGAYFLTFVLTRVERIKGLLGL